jgi:hypothetical protein
MTGTPDRIEWPFRQLTEPAEMSFEVSVERRPGGRDAMVSLRFPALKRGLLLTPRQAAATAEALRQAAAGATHVGGEEL